MIALLLAMLYLPATGHCIMEQAGWLPSGGDCCEQAESHQDIPINPCAVSCCPSENTAYFSVATSLHTYLIAEVPVCLIALALAIEPEQSATPLPGSSPPELAKVWQFSFRAALPPRAPSFVS